MAKDEAKAAILSFAHEQPRTWSEMEDRAEELDISKSTLSRYINELKEDGLMEKVIWEDNVCYTASAPDQVDEETMNDWFTAINAYNSRMEEEIEIIKALDAAGLFDDGITDNDLTELFEEFDEFEPPIGHVEAVTDDGDITAEGLAALLMNLPFSAKKMSEDGTGSPVVHIDGLRVDGSADQWIQHIKDAMEQNEEAITALREKFES